MKRALKSHSKLTFLMLSRKIKKVGVKLVALRGFEPLSPP